MNKIPFQNTTLVPVDFSDTSLHALDHAVAIAKIIEDGNPRVTLVHVIEGAEFESVSAEDVVDSSNKEGLMIEGAKNKLEKIIAAYSPKGELPFNYIITGGKVYRKIAELAEELTADSIVMGTHGAQGWGRFIGSNASRVIQVAPCPVVTIKEKQLGNGYKNLILPLDLTKETKQKVSWAVKIASYFKSTVHLVTITEDDEFLARRVKANLKQVEGVLKEKGITYTSTYLTEDSSSFAEATLNFARGRDADLIIIMTQQEKTLGEFIFGSYAQRIVKTSSIPVMAINPRADLTGIFERTLG
ncbi:MAG: universal stress protein [Bacteroidia bacterium]